MEDIFANLNSSQRQAVENCSGPSLIIAGAGSGKTRVLTCKIANLLMKGIKPWKIMALTFTNKAAREMVDRISNYSDYQAVSRIWMGTFHSIFLKILRSEYEILNFPHDFTIYDTADSKSLLRSILKEMELKDNYKVNRVMSRISYAKNNLISPAAYAKNADCQEHDIYAKIPLIKIIYNTYMSRCKKAGAMDFDDILYYTNFLFSKYPEITEKYQDKFSHILVDEYQDTNYSQYLIIKKLAEKHKNITVVGDDSQSIYSFRGANISNILNFQKTYPESKIFKLEQNYRSTQNIVNAANSLIDKNQKQIKKTIFSKNEVGSKIKVSCAYSDIEEGFIVANKINSLILSKHYSLEDFVILYRTNAQSRIFEESLRKRNLKYRIYGGTSFYQRKEIKDIISYFRLVVNTSDEEAFKRIINFPKRGIGKTTLDKINTAATENSISLWDVLDSPLDFGVKINSGTQDKLNNFRELLLHFISETKTVNAFDLAQELTEKIGLMKPLKNEERMETQSRIENVNELMGGIKEFCDSRIEEGNSNILLSDFLSEVSLLTDQDESEDDNSEKITLMTIHASKGLEFKNVFIVGLEEELFPSAHCIDHPNELEEERRLLYVAITRAETNCFFSYAKSRFRNGQSNFTKKSRFIDNISADFLDEENDKDNYYNKQNNNTNKSLWNKEKTFSSTKENKNYINKQKLTRLSTQNIKNKYSNQTNSGLSNASCNLTTPSPSSKDSINIGSEIIHNRFGKGIIKDIEGSGENCIFKVDFENVGSKRLLKRFAKFKIVK